MAFNGTIDPPGAFEPIGDWVAYVEELRAMSAAPEVDDAIKQAEQFIRLRESEAAQALPLDPRDYRDL